MAGLYGYPVDLFRLARWPVRKFIRCIIFAKGIIRKGATNHGEKAKLTARPSRAYTQIKTGEAPYRVVFRYLDKTGKTKQITAAQLPYCSGRKNEFRRQKSKLEQAQTPVDDQITLNEYLDYWKNRYVLPRLKQSTIDGYLNCIRIIQDHLGQIRLYKLSHSTINTFYLHLQDDPAAR